MSALSVSVVCRGTDWPTAQHPLDARFLSPDARSAISLALIEGPVGPAGNLQRRSLFAVLVANVPVDFPACCLHSVLVSVLCSLQLCAVHTAIHLLRLTI